MRDAAAMAAQSDPLLNPHFRRRWGPPLKRKRPRSTGIGQGAEFEGVSSEQDNSYSLRLLQAAFRLDRRADIECTAGRHDVAERLAHKAQELREVMR